MANSPVETELMRRTLHEIEWLLAALEASARAHQCLPRDEHAAYAFTPPNSRQQPGRSALYFCLTSASALLDVSRTLLGQLEKSANDRPDIRSELSALSKAAGQSAFLASVMLADPQPQPAITPRQAGPWALTHLCRAAAVPVRPTRAHFGTRVKATLRSLLGSLA